MNEIYAALLSWAITLSGYPAPERPPTVIKQPHSFFVEKACHGRECKVLGWYAGGTEIYIDDRLDPEKNLLASSIVVHEMVHYLQSVARGDDAPRNGVAAAWVPIARTAAWPASPPLMESRHTDPVRNGPVAPSVGASPSLPAKPAANCTRRSG